MLSQKGIWRKNFKTSAKSERSKKYPKTLRFSAVCNDKAVVLLFFRYLIALYYKF